MPIRLDDNGGKRWLVARATGELRLDEILRFLRTARNSGDARYAALLFDARGATTRLTEAEVEQAVLEVAAIRRTSGDREHVAVVADDDVVFARMLHYEVRCAEIGVRVIRAFRQEPDAEQWLAAMVGARHLR